MIYWSSRDFHRLATRRRWQQALFAPHKQGLWDQGLRRMARWNQTVNSCGMDVNRRRKEAVVVLLGF